MDFLFQALDPFLEDEDPFLEACGSQSDQKMLEFTNSIDVLSVNQLIESVHILSLTQQ